MVGFPFQVLGVFSLQKFSSFLLNSFSLLRSGLVFYFYGTELLFETGKVRNVYPVTVLVSGVSQTAKTEV